MATNGPSALLAWNEGVPSTDPARVAVARATTGRSCISPTTPYDAVYGPTLRLLMRQVSEAAAAKQRSVRR